MGYAPLAAYAECDAPFRAAASSILLEVASALSEATKGREGRGGNIGNVVIVGHAVHSAMCGLLVARALSRGGSGDGTCGDAEGAFDKGLQGSVLMSEEHAEAEAFHITAHGVSILHARGDAQVNWGKSGSPETWSFGDAESGSAGARQVSNRLVGFQGALLVALFACVHLVVMGFRYRTRLTLR